MAERRPILAITMGDPAGVGPEVIVDAWSDFRLHERARLFVLGHPEILRRALQLRRVDRRVLDIESPDALTDGDNSSDTIPCINVCDDNVLAIAPGRVDRRAGEAAFQAVRAAAELALANRIDGMITAPLHKVALHAAGHDYPGHTELLAHVCGVTDFAMMLYLPPVGNGDCPPVRKGTVPISGRAGLGVVHVTLHQSLRTVFAALTPQSILAKCCLADGVMRRLGAAKPRIAVCALNPHAGEDGLFGDEERTIIAPAVKEAKRGGLNVSGPFPTDTLMTRARDGEFDAVVAMYHDQGHIAIKLLGMHAAVNITLGLPIVRTSVAHGTAFDRAWQGTARSEGMVAAILTAAKLVSR